MPHKLARFNPLAPNVLPVCTNSSAGLFPKFCPKKGRVNTDKETFRNDN